MLYLFSLRLDHLVKSQSFFFNSLFMFENQTLQPNRYRSIMVLNCNISKKLFPYIRDFTVQFLNWIIFRRKNIPLIHISPSVFQRFQAFSSVFYHMITTQILLMSHKTTPSIRYWVKSNQGERDWEKFSRGQFIRGRRGGGVLVFPLKIQNKSF